MSMRRPRCLPTKLCPPEEKWLIDKVDYFFHQAEQSSKLDQAQIDRLVVLVGALKVLGLNGAAQSFLPRLQVLSKLAYLVSPYAIKRIMQAVKLVELCIVINVGMRLRRLPEKSFCSSCRDLTAGGRSHRLVY